MAAVRAKIELGEGDAAIVYVTDAMASGEAVIEVAMPARGERPGDVRSGRGRRQRPAGRVAGIPRLARRAGGAGHARRIRFPASAPVDVTLSTARSPVGGLSPRLSRHRARARHARRRRGAARIPSSQLPAIDRAKGLEEAGLARSDLGVARARPIEDRTRGDGITPDPIAPHVRFAAAPATHRAGRAEDDRQRCRWVDGLQDARGVTDR